MKKVVLLDIIQDDFWSIPESFISILKETLKDVEITIVKDLEKERHHLKEAQGIISFPIPANLVRGNEKLEWIHFLSAQVPLSWQKLQDKYLITNSKAGCSGVAEHALFLALKGLRGNSWSLARLASSSRLGIIGYGNIGKKLSELTLPLFKEVRFLTHRDSSPAGTNCFNYDKAHNFFKDLDIIIIATSLNESSQNFFQSQTFFKELTKDTILVNISRGELFEEKDIFDFYSQNKEATYLTDVTYPEPYPKEGKLRKLPNIFITPHIGGKFEGLWRNFEEEFKSLFKDRK